MQQRHLASQQSAASGAASPATVTNNSSGQRPIWPVGLKSSDALTSRALLVSPLLAILAIIALLGVLIWLLDRDERASQREELIRDALWVEQALRFQLDSETSRLSRLAQDLADDTAPLTAFEAQAGQLVQINREMIEIVRLDAAGRVVSTVPKRPAPSGIQFLPAVKTLDELARAAGRGGITPPFRLPDDRGVVAHVAPVVSTGEPRGSLVAIFSLDTMLSLQVPWWIAERRAVSIRDGKGVQLASRSAIETEPGAPAYTVEIGDPLVDAQLTVSSFHNRSNLAHNSVIGAMIALGLFAAAGLVAREHHVRRRRAVEAALGEEHAFRRAMEASLQVGVRARDMQGRILYVNQGFCRMTGFTEDELIGRDTPMPYWLPEDIEHTQQLHDAILAGQSVGQSVGQGLEFTFRRKDGSLFHALVYEAPLIDAQGRQRGWMGSFIDITDRKQAEELARLQADRMQHTARLVTVGEMASLIAHELNQPLAAIRSYAAGAQNMIAADQGGSAPLAEAIGRIGDSAERAGRIVRRVHSFVKRSEPKLEPVNIREVVADTLALLEPELRKAHVLTETRLQPMLPLVRADRVLIEQVLVNLVRNALEAMRDTTVDQRRLLVSAEWPDPEGRLAVSVEDWGCGIDPSLSGRLFAPFQSTKANGMGMGLSICRSIMELHGGRINYAPADHGGTIFRFVLAVNCGEAE